MDTNTLLLVSLGVVLFILLIVFVFKRKQEERKPNYRALFIIGISFLPLGISTENYTFSAIGTIFMIIGIANRKKWDKPKKWSELSYNERRFKITLIVILSFLIFAGIVAFLMVEK